MVIAEWLAFPISSELTGIILVSSAVAFLLSEKIEGRTLALVDKAFSYFASYVLVFSMLVRHQRGGPPGSMSPSISTPVSLVLVAIILYQIRYFTLQVKEKKETLWILALGALAAVYISSLLLLSLR